MKHFGASLTGISNAVDDGVSILKIGASTAAQADNTTKDSIVIYNIAGPSNATDKVATAGSEAAGLVIVPSAAGRGATHIIGADGREVAITDVGGGLNPSNLFVPIRGASGADANKFLDSAISQAASGKTEAVTVGGDLTVTGNFHVNGMESNINAVNTYVRDRYFETNHPIPGETYVGGLTGGLVVVQTSGGDIVTATADGSLARTVDEGTTAPIGTDTDLTFDGGPIPAAGSGGNVLILTAAIPTPSEVVSAPFAIVTGGFTTQTAVLDRPLSALGIIPADNDTMHFTYATVSGAGSLTGAGLRFNPTTSTWQAATSIANLGTDANIDSTGNWADLTTASSGVNSVGAGAGLVLATGSTPTTPTLDVNVGTAGTRTLEIVSDVVGVRDDSITEAKLDISNSASDGFILSYKDGSDQLTWLDPNTIGGGAEKYSGTHAVATGTITIPYASTPVANTSHQFDTADINVVVYEFLTSANAQHTGGVIGDVATLSRNQIFPESVKVGNTASGSGSDLRGTVTITLPVAQNDNFFRVVITG